MVIIVIINFLFTNTSLYSLRIIVATTFLFMPFASVCSLLSTRNDHIFTPKDSSIPTLPVLSFIFPVTNLFELS